MEHRRRQHRYVWYAALVALAAALVYTVSSYVSQKSQEAANLPYYVAAEEFDPIFSIEGTDPAKLRAAVATLLAQKDEIAALHPDQKATLGGDTLYPAAFLSGLADLEEARQALKSDPSVARAEHYHALLDQSIDAYAADVQTLSVSLQESAAQYPAIGYLGGTSSTTDVAAKLGAVAAQAGAQKQKEDARYACFLHLSSGCPSLAALASARSALLRTPARVAMPDARVRMIDRFVKQMLPVYAGFGTTSNELFAVPSDCYPTLPAYLRAYYLQSATGETERKLAFVNDAYFYDIAAEKAREPDVPLYGAILNAGAAFKYQSVGNLYMCPDSGLDAASVGSMLGVLDALRQKQDPTAQERALLALPVMQKADLAPYIQQEAATSTSAAQDLIERYLEGSADFDQVVLGAYNDNLAFIKTAKENPQGTYDFVSIARNFASVLFLLGNPTFMPQRISLFTTRVPNAPSKLLLRSYGDVSRQFTDTQLIRQTAVAIKTEMSL